MRKANTCRYAVAVALHASIRRRHLIGVPLECYSTLFLSHQHLVALLFREHLRHIETNKISLYKKYPTRNRTLPPDIPRLLQGRQQPSNPYGRSRLHINPGVDCYYSFCYACYYAFCYACLPATPACRLLRLPACYAWPRFTAVPLLHAPIYEALHRRGLARYQAARRRQDHVPAYATTGV